MTTALLPSRLSRATAPVAVPEARFHTGAWVGIGLLIGSLAVRAVLYGLIDPSAPRPRYFLVGWPVLRALFPHGQVGAAIFTAQATVLLAGIVAAAQTRAFTDLDDSTRRGAIGLQVAGLASVVPLGAAAVITVIPAVGVTLVALVVVGALHGFR